MSRSRIPSKTSPMDRFWKEWGPVVKAMGAKGFQDFCKKCGGKLVPTSQELLNIGRGEIIREHVAAGRSLFYIEHNDKLGQGRIEEILKKLEEEGKKERREEEGTDEYGD